LRAYQKILPQIKGFGATLLAISPQTPDKSQATLLKNFLEYTVLSDVGNVVARQFGLVYPLAKALRPIYRDMGVDLAEYNNDDSWELPLAGTFVIDREGVIRLANVDADYTRRLEPAKILESLAALPNK
jgi:peroxiredoxin